MHCCNGLLWLAHHQKKFEPSLKLRNMFYIVLDKLVKCYKCICFILTHLILYTYTDFKSYTCTTLVQTPPVFLGLNYEGLAFKCFGQSDIPILKHSNSFGFDHIRFHIQTNVGKFLNFNEFRSGYSVFEWKVSNFLWITIAT